MIGEWLDYSLADFLLFAPSTYWRLFEQLNSALWPLHLLMTALIAGVAIIAVQAMRWAGVAVGVCLALCWALVAHLFFTSYYAPINWAIEWVIPLAWAQADLLILLAPGLRFEGVSRPWPQIALVGLALTYPLVGVLDGRPIAQSEVAGIAPDPTAVLTLGLVWFARCGWRGVVLSVLPILWLTFSAVTLFAMDVGSSWAPIAVLVGAGVSGLWMLVQRFWPADASR